MEHARFKIAFEKACGYETPTAEAEVGEFVDFTFAELNGRGRSCFVPRQNLGGGCIFFAERWMIIWTPEWCHEIQRYKSGGVKPCAWPRNVLHGNI